MKNFFKLSVVAIALSAVNAFATGAQGVNPYQSGIINTATNGAAIQYSTNTFAFPFQTVPVVTLFSLGQTNVLPFTNVVTTTNFIVQSATNGFNASIAWQAYAGTPRIQAFTFTNVAAIATNVTFPYPYAQVPVVVVIGQSTNVAATVGVYNVTLTGFSFICNQGQTNQAEVIGISPAQSQDATTGIGQNDVKY